ncbi:hypothetical protein GIB67_012546 [Kingdonia uniflora]|uniref:Uncharacterized protein n=1 Tax=Kingdonia uniflora TaxID=39325 RepID=A0A7J7N672_9MAGN|nr:hypothetical protein GIB67_012546 [Kingdonia uniflora]
MNGVQLYTIVHFGGDIVHLKIGSIVSYAGGSTKLISLRAYSSYEDFVTLLEETSEIRREDCKGLSTTKDTGSGKGLSTTKAGGPLSHNSFPDPDPEYRGYPETNGRGLDPRRYGVAYINNVESWNNIILKVRDLPIHVFIEELRRIYLEMSYTYREEAKKSQARLTPWATDHCESRKFMADSLTCKVRPSHHHFQMTSYGRTDSVNIEDVTCLCRWWQTMGIPSEHGVRALGLANVDPTTRVFEYFTNNTYKAVYEPIWIPIRGIEQ